MPQESSVVKDGGEGCQYQREFCLGFLNLTSCLTLVISLLSLFLSAVKELTHAPEGTCDSASTNTGNGI